MISLMDGTLKVGIRVTAPAVGELVTASVYPGLFDEYRVAAVTGSSAIVRRTGRRWSAWDEE